MLKKQILFLTFILVLLSLYSQEHLLYKEESDNQFLFEKSVSKYISKKKLDTLYWLNENINLPSKIKKCVLIQLNDSIIKKLSFISKPEIIEILPIEIKNGQIIIQIRNFDYGGDDGIDFTIGFLFEYYYNYNKKKNIYEFYKEKEYYY